MMKGSHDTSHGCASDDYSPADDPPRRATETGFHVASSAKCSMWNRSELLSRGTLRTRHRPCMLHAHALGLVLLACLTSASARESSQSSRDVIRLGGEWIDISKALPPSSSDAFTQGWRGAACGTQMDSGGSGVLRQAGEVLGGLWMSMRRVLGGRPNLEGMPQQWYVALTPGARIDRLEATADVAIGLAANVGVHVMTGTASAARRLAADSQVRWVGLRPSHHKLDSTLRQFTDPLVQRRAAPVPEAAFADGGSNSAEREALTQHISIRTLVATLVSPRTHSRGLAKSSLMGISAEEFVDACEGAFEERGWRSSVSVVSDVRVAVHLDASILLGAQRRKSAGPRNGGSEKHDRESVENIAWVLSGMWQVLWVEPKQFFRPTIRYAAKMLTFPSTHATYQTDIMRRAATNAFNSPSQTGSMEVMSAGTGVHSGKFCMHLNDTPRHSRLVLGANGSHPDFLNPIAVAEVGHEYLVEPLHDDGFNRTTGVQVILPAGSPLYFDDDYFAGMQLELVYIKDVDDETPTVVRADCFPWPDEATREMQQFGQSPVRTCPRMITGYSAATGRVDFFPPWKLEKGMTTRGRRVTIRPLLMPGDQITVLADAESWRGTVRLDWLQEMQKAEAGYVAAADQTLRLDCARLPGGGAHNRVAGDVSTASFLRDHGFGPLQAACAADVQQEGAVSLAKPSGLTCSEACRADRAVMELEKSTGVCVFNQSRVVGSDRGGQGDECTCSYSAAVPLRMELKLPDANPLWDRGLNGSGQVVGMADTGLDATNCLLSESDPVVSTSSNLVRAPEVSTGIGDMDQERRKIAGYQMTASEDCKLCDTCGKRIKWDRTLLFGDVAKVVPGAQFKTPFPHRCGDEAGAILSKGGPNLQACCGHTCQDPCTGGPVSPCGSCTCTLNAITGDKQCEDEVGDDCTYREPDCVSCCWACGHDARLWPRRYDKYGAELEVGLEAIAPPPNDFPVEFRIFVFTREDYERYVIWSEQNPGQDPPVAADPPPYEPAPRCLNPDCLDASSKKQFVGGQRIRLPPSRYGYGVIITNAQSDALPEKHTMQLYGLLKDGVGLQMYTASRPCGDTSDDTAGHGTLCASVAAGAVDPDTPSRAQRLAARPHQGIAKGARLFMFDLSAGKRGADNITVPLDFYQGALAPSYARGVRIMSNSWSCYFPQVVCDQLGCVPTKADYCNSYSTAAADMDSFVVDHPEMLLLVPAGDTNVLAYDAQQQSVRSPGTCKNCIAVGSSHNYNSALMQSIPLMDAMDQRSSPLRGHRALCPRNLLGEESLWRSEESVAAEEVAPDDAATEATDGAMPQTTPAGQGAVLAEFIQPEDKYAVPEDCCQDDPKHNELVNKNIAFYLDQLQLQRDTGSPLAVQQVTLDKIAAERARLYPCTAEPSCCNLNDNTKDDLLDATDWTSLGPQKAMCCKDSYLAATRPGNLLHPTEFDVDKVASFSAQGPVIDDAVLKGDFKGENPPGGLERIKPDLVAPGAYVVGAKSRGNTLGGLQRHCELPGDPEHPLSANSTLVSMGGTSISTAIVAGAAAIVRQYFEQGYYPSGRPTKGDRLTPSAALIKAVLINSASSVQDSAAASEPACKTYAKGLLTEICVPNYEEGWGRPNIADVLWLGEGGPAKKPLWVVDETVGLSQDRQVHEYTFYVDMTQENPRLDVTLVWSDPPPLPGSEMALVNDLDLVVSTSVAVGWVNGKICDIDPFTDDYFESKDRCQRPIPDRVNNVEKTEMDLLHMLRCKYANGDTVEYRACNREGTMGILGSSEKDRRPMQVSVKVVAHRILLPCVSDGYYKTCSQRPQPYSLAVSGPLLMRKADALIHPPTLTAYQMPEISNSTLSGSTRERGGGGRQLLLPALLALFSILFIVYPNDG